MTIVNCCVVNKNGCKTLLKWKIVKCEVENTVGGFFSVVCRLHIAVDPNLLTLEAAFVGKTKDALDLTALDIDLGEVVRMFGAFLKYEVFYIPAVDESTSTSTVSALLQEALYYSAKYEPICVYCARPQPFTDDKQYPLCVDCKDKPPVLKKK